MNSSPVSRRLPVQSTLHSNGNQDCKRCSYAHDAVAAGKTAVGSPVSGLMVSVADFLAGRLDLFRLGKLWLVRYRGIEIGRAQRSLSPVMKEGGKQ